ncbi:MAG: beta-ketoacyl-[acyl-carrier-protein] synthase II [Lachnospiraceae bacterium]|nr:beta-ketoacyl-[acyl-carrier-protein] synthase II [Lachnospiraceae bacterium]
MRRVVVTGLGAVTPIGNNMEEYWNGLVNGVNGIAPITRFDTTDFKSTLAAEVKNFDPSAVLDKGTVRKTDLYTQYALVSADEAMQDSGLAGNIAEDELGVYFGSGVGGIETTLENHDGILAGGPRKVSPQFVPKMIINIAAGQIAIRFNAHGNAMCMSTACATGTTAIGEAYRAIKDGYLTAAICGGSESSVNPLCVAGFINCMALSQATDPNEASLPFDSRRAGFVLGEGAATLILEEYEHAVARGAKIYAEICGYGATCDAHHVTAPDPEATYTAKAIEKALAGVDYATDSLYINAHGTGTALNDATETKAFKLAFGEEGAKNVKISSTKSMTGHMLGAAGAAEAIACVKALETGILPPTINLTSPDPALDLDYVPCKAQNVQVDTAISTSLGFGGHNACIAFRRVK